MSPDSQDSSMSLLSKACFALANPIQARYLLQQKISPRSLLERGCRLACRAGLTRPIFILSFDCDTEKDIHVVWDVHSRLADIGITPVYAVPGRLLEKGEKVYRRIADCDAEFINHGYAEHASFDESRNQYESFYFYDQLPRESVREDIVNGDKALREVLGIDPRGFRTPHFGTFQKEKELHFLHGVLKDLGYAFSTSTVPFFSLRYGPVFDRYGLPELPVSGCPDRPMMTLDSWSFRYAPGKAFTEDDYVRQIEGWVAFLECGGSSYLVNVYADPSQVYNWPEFFEAMKHLVPFSVPSYSAFLESIG